MSTVRQSGTGSAGSTKSSQSHSSGSRKGLGSAGSNKEFGSGDKPRSAGSGTRAAKPSDRFNQKTVDPFTNNSKAKTAFATVYSSGGLPCRLVHGSVKHKLAWDISVEDIPFDQTLVTFAEGIRETVHPYTFVARSGFKGLLEASNAEEKATPLVPKLAPPLRAALAHPDGSVFEAGLEALVQLSDVVGAALNSQLKSLVGPISKHAMDKKYRETITDALHKLEMNGGKDALICIKSKVPTYTSIGS